MAYSSVVAWLAPAMGGGIGALLFIAIFGVALLDPTVIPATLSGDNATQWLGWSFFRQEPWQWPPGRIEGYLYPQGTSLVYTDAIPLLALPLKLFSPWLPEPLQYQGLWLLSCFVLQGAFTVLLMRRFGAPLGLQLLMALLLCLYPPLWLRTWGHDSLVAHWTLLAALWLYLYPNAAWVRRGFTLLLVATSLIHFYLLFMVLLIWGAWGLNALGRDFALRPIGLLLLHGATTLALTLAAMTLAGYFVIAVDSSGNGGFGLFSMNLLAPLNPGAIDGFSLLNPIANATPWQDYEGFNYLGFGALLLLSIAAYEAWRQPSALRQGLNRHLPLITILALLTALALSHRIAFGPEIVAELPLADEWIFTLGTLRSSGRLFWPVAYALLLGASLLLLRRAGGQIAQGVVALAIALQLLDGYAFYLAPKRNQPAGDLPALTAPLWPALLERYRHIAFVPPQRQGDDFVPFARLAQRYGATINVANVARYDPNHRAAYEYQLRRHLQQGHYNPQTLYILRSTAEGDYPTYTASAGTAVGTLDGQWLIAPGLAPELAAQLAPPPTIYLDDEPPLTMAEVIERYGETATILMAVKDDGLFRLPSAFIQQLRQRGSRIGELNFRGAYAAILHRGQLAAEALSNQSAVALEQTIEGTHFALRSAGLTMGNDAAITAAGQPLITPRRGFNVVVYRADQPPRRYYFDPHAAPPQLTSRAR